MTLEIELKARLDNVAPVKERLFAAGNYLRSYKKSDSYWVPAQTAPHHMADTPTVRVRRDHGTSANGKVQETTLITYKTKNISDGIEVNDEREFIVSDVELFEDLLGRLGLYKDICKEKEGWAWIIPVTAAGLSETVQETNILAELSMVTGLGWFLELEITTGDTDEKIVAESRKLLLAMLAKLEIPAEWIEPRPYTAMLREIQ